MLKHLLMLLKFLYVSFLLQRFFIRSLNNVNAIRLEANAGTDETIVVHSNQGTGEGNGNASIELLSDAGGVELRSTANLANAINLTSDGGTSGTITLFNDQGTAVNEGVASIQLLSDVGGIGIKSGLNAAGAIRLTADAGSSETIVLHADQGNATASICLTSDAGGITLNPGTFVTVGGIADAEIRLFEDTGAGCNYAAIKVQNMAASYTLTLPADDGCCGEALTTNGSGVLTWAAASGGGSDQHVNLATTATQSLSTGSITPLIFQTETTDTNTMHGACSACVTIKVAGTYGIHAATLFTGNSCGSRDLYIYKGSCIIGNVRSPTPPIGGNFQQQINLMSKLAADDVLQFRARQASGGALTTLNCGNVTRFQVTLLYED